MKPDSANPAKLIPVPGDIADRWKNKSASEITSADILMEIKRVSENSGGASANRRLDSLKGFFRWCTNKTIDHPESILAISPCLNIQNPAPKTKRRRFLTDDEIAKVWGACDVLADQFGTSIRLLMVTGQRRSEVAQMSEAELNLTDLLWLLSESRTKNGNEHEVPLSDLAARLIEGIRTYLMLRICSPQIRIKALQQEC